MEASERLAKVSLFRGLSPDDLGNIAARLTERRFAAGEKIFALGDPGKSMFIVASGCVRVFLPAAPGRAERVVLKDLGPGSHVGELAVFDEQPRSASAEAAEPTTLLELSKEDFIASLVRSPDAVLAILSEMSNRLRDTNQMLSQRAARDAVKEVEEGLSWAERLADKVAAINGSWAFIIVLCGVTIVWAVINALLSRPFDSYPYVFFNLVLALLVAFQGPLIVMSQNRQAAKERAQAASDFQVNLKNEVNIETLVRQVAEMRRETNERLERLEATSRPGHLKVSA